MHNDFSNFLRNSFFEGTYSLQVKDSSWLYHVCLRRIVYVMQEPLKEELERLQKQQIIVPMEVDETSEWSNSFILVPR